MAPDSMTIRSPFLTALVCAVLALLAVRCLGRGSHLAGFAPTSFVGVEGIAAPTTVASCGANCGQ